MLSHPIASLEALADCSRGARMRLDENRLPFCQTVGDVSGDCALDEADYELSCPCAELQVCKV